MIISREELLRSYGWEHPKHYMGYSPDGELVAMAIHRDSSYLEKSNWEVLLERLGGEGEHVYTWRASHSMVGWVEYMMLKITAPDKLLNVFSKAMASLEDYPILNEDHHSQMTWDAFEEYRATMSEEEWAELVEEEGSVEAAEDSIMETIY